MDPMEKAIEIMRRDRVRKALWRAHGRGEAVIGLLVPDTLVLVAGGVVEVTDADTRLTPVGHMVAEAIRSEAGAWRDNMDHINAMA